MWNKRKEEVFVPKSAAPPRSAEPAREGIPMSTLPGRLPEPEAPRGMATIGKSVVLKGQVFSREDLYVDGELDGTIELLEHRLTVGPHAKLSATIKAREVVIMGSVRGNIENEIAERADLFENEVVVLTHLTLRTTPDEIRRTVARRLPPRLAARTVPFLPE